MKLGISMAIACSALFLMQPLARAQGANGGGTHLADRVQGQSGASSDRIRAMATSDPELTGEVLSLVDPVSRVVILGALGEEPLQSAARIEFKDGTYATIQGLQFLSQEQRLAVSSALDADQKSDPTQAAYAQTSKGLKPEYWYEAKDSEAVLRALASMPLRLRSSIQGMAVFLSHSQATTPVTTTVANPIAVNGVHGTITCIGDTCPLFF